MARQGAIRRAADGCATRAAGRRPVRATLGRLVVVVLGLSIGLGAPAASAQTRSRHDVTPANPVAAENALPGDTGWQAALTDPAANSPISGYALATGVRPGAAIAFAVNAPAGSRYRVEISRLGWYGGSGGRRLTCLEGTALDPACTGDEAASVQPAAPPPDPTTGELAAGWTTTDTLTVPSSWVSGYYLAIFRLTAGPAKGRTAFAPFIVQAPAGVSSTVLVEVPTNTWQAYNTWGGQDLYTTPEAVKVSFNRPYAHRLLFRWELPLVRFLERGGWNVSYVTDDEVDANPSLLLHHALDMSAGHDEYWTSAMRDGWQAARDAGVNLAFMGADDGFWQVRYEDGDRTMVGYKYLPDPVSDPARTTTAFRWLTPARPECELMGVEFQGTVISGTNFAYTADPAVATDPWFAGSGLTPGSVFPGLGGYEVDSITPGCHVPPVTPLLTYTGPAVKSNFDGAPTEADAARYTACSGAEVFAAGSLQFTWGLDSFRDSQDVWAGVPVNPGLQLAMTRAMNDLTVSHVPVPGPPDICVPSPSFSEPAGWAAVGQPAAITSTATDAAGQIAAQSWSATGDGAPAAAAGASFSPVFPRPGTAQISLEVADTSGAHAGLQRSLRICACPAPTTTSAVPWAAGSVAASRPCGLIADGSLPVVAGRREFVPGPGATVVSATLSRLQVTAGRVRWVSRPLNPVPGTTAPSAEPGPAVLPIPSPGGAAPERVVIRLATPARILTESLLLVPGAPGTAPAVRPLSATACDGSSGEIVTPAFGGRSRSPLRVAVAGLTPVLVILSGSRLAPDARLVATSGDAPRIVSFPAGQLPAGLDHVTVMTIGSPLPERVTLAAVRIATPVLPRRHRSPRRRRGR